MLEKEVLVILFMKVIGFVFGCILILKGDLKPEKEDESGV